MKKIGNVIAKKRKESGLSQAALANRLLDYDIHVKNAAISSWEKNKNIPTAYQLLALCEVLQIKDIYAEFIEDTTDSILGGLNDEGVKRALEYIELLKKSDAFTQDSVIKKNITGGPNLFSRHLPIALLPASAGVGELVGEDYFEECDVNDDVPEEAEFGVRLKGDSMEPSFHDGQIVWIKRSDTVESGQVGLFLLEGNTYCKRFRVLKNKFYLVSDNTKYAPIEITSDNEFKVYGIVVGKENKNE